MLLCQLLQARFPCLQIPRKKQREVWTCLSNFRLACSQRLMDHVLCAHAAKLLNLNRGLGAVLSQQVRGIATWSCTPAGNWQGRRGNTAQWRKSAWQSGRRWTVVVRSSHTQTDVTVSEAELRSSTAASATTIRSAHYSVRYRNIREFKVQGSVFVLLLLLFHIKS